MPKPTWKVVTFNRSDALAQLREELERSRMSACFPTIKFVFDPYNEQVYTNCGIPLLLTISRVAGTGTPATRVLSAVDIDAIPALKEFVVC